MSESKDLPLKDRRQKRLFNMVFAQFNSNSPIVFITSFQSKVLNISTNESKDNLG
jgi:hypothetical protein